MMNQPSTQGQRFRGTQFPGYTSFTFFSDKFLLLVSSSVVIYIFQVLFSNELTIEQIVMLVIQGILLAYVFSMRKKTYQFINGRFSAYKVYYDAVAGKTFSKHDYLGDSSNNSGEGFFEILKKAALKSFLTVNRK